MGYTPRQGKILVLFCGYVRFSDSMHFMLQSLDSLVATLHPDEFEHVRKAYPLPEEFNLVSKKGKYPYDYMDSFQKSQVDYLSSCDEFFSQLNDDSISLEQYEHAQWVWVAFGCETMADYHDLYLECDVLLLADFFEKFRNRCLFNYWLDAAHYFTSPGVSFDAALRMTRVELQLLPNIDMLHFVEKGIRILVFIPCPDSLISSTWMRPIYTIRVGNVTTVVHSRISFPHCGRDMHAGHKSVVWRCRVPTQRYPLAPEMMDITSDMYSPLQ